jgi:hypothetical protein
LNIPIGYFYDQVFPTTPDGNDTDLSKFKIILKSKFGRQGFNDGTWKIIKSLNDFSREEYPLPIFYQKRDLIKGEIVYLNDDLLETKREVVLYDDSYYDGFPDIALRGSKVIEIQMLKILTHK